RVAEAREAAHPLAERELERRHQRQLIAKAEQLDRLVPRRVRYPSTNTKTVGECVGRWCASVCKCWIHIPCVLRKPCRLTRTGQRRFLFEPARRITEGDAGNSDPSSRIWRGARAGVDVFGPPRTGP